MRASLSAGRIRPCSSAMRRSGKTCVASRSASASAALTCGRFASSIAAHTTNAWRPSATSSRTRRYASAAFVGRTRDERLDRLPAGGKLVEDGHVEVAVVRERERPRDRRRGHDQHVRRRALLLQHHALVDAEPVLLVDHGQRQVGELDPFLDQGMGADHDRSTSPSRTPSSTRCRSLPVTDPVSSAYVRGAAFDCGASAASPANRLVWSSRHLGPRAAARGSLQDVAGAQRGEQRLRRSEMLRRKHFGGSHDRGLVARLDGHHGGVQSATAVFPEPTSPCSSRCIGRRSAMSCADLLGCPGLRFGQGERQPADERRRRARRSGRARRRRRGARGGASGTRRPAPG